MASRVWEGSRQRRQAKTKPTTVGARTAGQSDRHGRGER